jgi:hypothetical protein
VRSNRQNRPAGRPNNEVRPTDGTHANFPYSAELHEVPTHVSLRLERVRGQIGDDGIERISTQTLFDHLEVFQRSRGGGACRRLAQVMRELGWTPVRVRDLTRGGYKEQVRGYCPVPVSAVGH